MIENLPSKALLESIAIEWGTAHDNLRDSYITIGRLLHQYILVRLKEGDTLNESERLSDLITRESFTEDAASRLGITRLRVNELIAVSQCVDLLSDNTLLLNISYSSLREFRVLIKRVTDKRAGRGRSVDASERERWIIKPEYSNWAVDLFQRSVRNNSIAKDIKDEITKYAGRKIKCSPDGVSSNSKSRSKSTLNNTTIPQPSVSDPDIKSRKQMLYEIGRVGSPRDVKDTILQMIVNSEDPRSLAKMVMSELGNLLEYKDKPNLFNVG